MVKKQIYDPNNPGEINGGAPIKLDGGQLLGAVEGVKAGRDSRNRKPGEEVKVDSQAKDDLSRAREMLAAQEQERKERAEAEKRRKNKELDKQKAVDRNNLYTGHYYDFLLARMFGRRQTTLIPKYAYVNVEEDEDNKMHYVSRFMTQTPYRNTYDGGKGDRKVAIPEFKSADGTRYQPTVQDVYDPSGLHYKRDYKEMMDVDESLILRPTIERKGKRYAVYTDRSGKQHEVYVPKTAEGILMHATGQGKDGSMTYEPFVRFWFPFTMSGEAKDLAFEDEMFVHHVDHVYAKMIELMRNNENLKYSDARNIAENWIRQMEAEGYYDDEKEFDWNVIRQRALEVEINRQAELQLAKEGFPPADQMGTIENDLKRKKRKEELLDSETKAGAVILKRATAVTERNEAKQKAQIEHDLGYYKDAELQWKQRLAYYEGQMLDEFWADFREKHPEMKVEQYEGSDGFKKFDVIFTPTDEEMFSMNTSGRLSFDQILDLNRTLAQQAHADFVHMYSPSFKKTKDISMGLRRLPKEDRIGLEMAWKHENAVSNAIKKGLIKTADEYGSLPDKIRDKVESEVARFWRGLKAIQKEVALQGLITRDKDAIIAQQQAEEQAMLDETNRKKAEYEAKVMADYAERILQEQAERAKKEQERLESRPTLKDLALAASKRIKDAMTPINEQKELIEERNAAISKEMSAQWSQVDSWPMMKILQLAERNMRSGNQDKRGDLVSMIDPHNRYGPYYAALINDMGEHYLGNNAQDVNELWRMDTSNEFKGEMTNNAADYIHSIYMAARKEIMQNKRPSYNSELLGLMGRVLDANNAGKESYKDPSHGFTGEGEDYLANFDLATAQRANSEKRRKLREMSEELLGSESYQADRQAIEDYTRDYENRANKRHSKVERMKIGPDGKATIVHVSPEKDTLPKASPTTIRQIDADVAFDKLMSEMPDGFDYDTLTRMTHIAATRVASASNDYQNSIAQYKAGMISYNDLEDELNYLTKQEQERIAKDMSRHGGKDIYKDAFKSAFLYIFRHEPYAEAQFETLWNHLRFMTEGMKRDYIAGRTGTLPLWNISDPKYQGEKEAREEESEMAVAALQDIISPEALKEILAARDNAMAEARKKTNVRENKLQLTEDKDLKFKDKETPYTRTQVLDEADAAMKAKFMELVPDASEEDWKMLQDHLEALKMAYKEPTEHDDTEEKEFEAVQNRVSPDDLRKIMDAGEESRKRTQATVKDQFSGGGVARGKIDEAMQEAMEDGMLNKFTELYPDANKADWELFLKHVKALEKRYAEDAPGPTKDINIETHPGMKVNQARLAVLGIAMNQAARDGAIQDYGDRDGFMGLGTNAVRKYLEDAEKVFMDMEPSARESYVERMQAPSYDNSISADPRMAVLSNILNDLPESYMHGNEWEDSMNGTFTINGVPYDGDETFQRDHPRIYGGNRTDTINQMNRILQRFPKTMFLEQEDGGFDVVYENDPRYGNLFDTFNRRYYDGTKMVDPSQDPEGMNNIIKLEWQKDPNKFFDIQDRKATVAFNNEMKAAYGREVAETKDQLEAHRAKDEGKGEEEKGFQNLKVSDVSDIEHLQADEVRDKKEAMDAVKQIKTKQPGNVSEEPEQSTEQPVESEQPTEQPEETDPTRTKGLHIPKTPGYQIEVIDPVKSTKKSATFQEIFKSEKEEKINRYNGVSNTMSTDDDPFSFRNMLKKANDEQAAKRGAPPIKVLGPNVLGGTMPNFMPSDRDATTPIEPEVRDDPVQGATRKEIKI